MVNYNLEKSYRGVKVLKCEGNPKRYFWSRKFLEFCERTDLHGYKYIAMNNLHYGERTCWAFFVTLSLACAAYFVVTAYRWYARNPIVTVIESTQGAIWDIPFPAVTICDLNIISRKAAQAFAHNLTLPVNVTADYIFESVRLVPLLHSTFFANDEQKNRLSELQSIMDMNNISIETLFRKLSPVSSCNHLLQRCMWKNTLYNCDQLFQQVFTMLSLCCTFNYFAINSKVQTAENHFLYSDRPRRVASCGYQTALTVLLNTDAEDYHSASIASQGVLVFVDSAYNIPNSDSPVRMVNPSTEVLIALTPERTYTSSGVKAFTPEQRQCYYYDEVNIGNFRHYSFHNCLAFQLAMIIKNYCECIPFFIPSKAAVDIDHEEDKYLVTDLVCLPECEHYDYPLEVALGKLSDKVQVNRIPFYNDVNLENRSILNVFFNDLVSTRYRRDVYLNWQNILAAFGGLLSLMLGFTLISGLDLILFFVLHVVYDGVKKCLADNANTGNKIGVAEIKRNDAWIKKDKSLNKQVSKTFGNCATGFTSEDIRY